MNQLVTTPHRSTAPALAQPPSPGHKATRILQAAEHMQAPWRLYDEMSAAHPQWIKAVFGELPTLDAMRHPERGEQARQRARDTLDLLPSQKLAADVLGALTRLEASEPDRGQTLALVATMVDGFPNARPHNPEAYVEGMVHEIIVAGHKPAVVARATREIVRSEGSRFPPVIAEILQACEKAASIMKMRDRVAEAQDRRQRIEVMLAEAERLGPRDLSEEWRAVMRLWKEAGVWPHYAGSQPGDIRCRVPDEIMREFGFEPFRADPDAIPF